MSVPVLKMGTCNSYYPQEWLPETNVTLPTGRSLHLELHSLPAFCRPEAWTAASDKTCHEEKGTQGPEGHPSHRESDPHFPDAWRAPVGTGHSSQDDSRSEDVDSNPN